MKCACAGRCGSMLATTAPLTEPTSVTIAPSRRLAAICFATGPQAPTGTQEDDEIAALHALGHIGEDRIGEAERIDPPRSRPCHGRSPR